jgi:hypothetical protein
VIRLQLDGEISHERRVFHANLVKHGDVLHVKRGREKWFAKAGASAACACAVPTCTKLAFDRTLMQVSYRCCRMRDRMSNGMRSSTAARSYGFRLLKLVLKNSSTLRGSSPEGAVSVPRCAYRSFA